MRAQTLPGAAGWQWLADGFALYRRHPPLLAALVMTYWLTVVFLNIVPLIGAVVSSVAIPGLSVGLMQACRHLERGEAANLATLFGGLRQNPRSLALLGIVYLTATLSILLFSALADGGELLRFMLSAQMPEKASLESGALVIPAILVMALLAPLLMAYWFAPVLAAWHDVPPFKALFFSFVACALNWRAFLHYGLALLLVAVIVPGLVLGILLLILPQAQNVLPALVSAPMMLVVAPAVFASFYISYRDVFGFSAHA